MKVKTSITLSEDLLDAVDELASEGGNRSRVIEAAVRHYLLQRKRRSRDRRDRDLLDEHADSLNAETADLLDLQFDP